MRPSALLLYFATLLSAPETPPPAQAPSSPFAVAFSPDGRLLAASDLTAGRLAFIDLAEGRAISEASGLREPCGLAWSRDGSSAYVAERASGAVAEVAKTGELKRRLRAGHLPVGVALAPRLGLLLVANSGEDSLSLIEIASGREKARLRAGREPWCVAVSPDEGAALVGNRSPEGPSTSADAAACVSWIDFGAPPSATDAPLHPSATNALLPPNAMNVLGVAFSPDGALAYAAHNLGRTNMSTERIANGWIVRNCITIFEVRSRRRIASVPLDSVGNGAANPWGLAVSPGNRCLWVSLSGVHELGRLDLESFFGALDDGRLPNAYGDRAAHDIGIFTDGRFRRTRLPGRGPRGVAVSGDGRLVAVALYFSGKIAVVDARSSEVMREISLGLDPEPDLARRGEEIFHDANRCYQRWLSCATCHPDGRADGLNWDLFNDGAGNPKNTRSLLLSHETPPAMSRGVRVDMREAVRAGFEAILFQPASALELEAVEAYIRSLKPVPSPKLTSGRLSARAERGKAIFESPEVGCASCHPPPLFTDLRSHDVGTRGALPWEESFDTPTLIELWRTAPYLHDGRAATLKEVVGSLNSRDLHGRTSHLSEEDLDALVEYLESL